MKMGEVSLNDMPGPAHKTVPHLDLQSKLCILDQVPRLVMRVSLRVYRRGDLALVRKMVLWTRQDGSSWAEHYVLGPQGDWRVVHKREGEAPSDPDWDKGCWFNCMEIYDETES